MWQYLQHKLDEIFRSAPDCTRAALNEAMKIEQHIFGETQPYLVLNQSQIVAFAKQMHYTDCTFCSFFVRIIKDWAKRFVPMDDKTNETLLQGWSARTF